MALDFDHKTFSSVSSSLSSERSTAGKSSTVAPFELQEALVDLLKHFRGAHVRLVVAHVLVRVNLQQRLLVGLGHGAK